MLIFQIFYVIFFYAHISKSSLIGIDKNRIEYLKYEHSQISHRINSSPSFCLCPYFKIIINRQWVTCLATDACLTADPEVASSIPVRSHTFVEIDHEMISTVILLPSAESFKKGCCQLQAKVCARITG